MTSINRSASPLTWFRDRGVRTKVLTAVLLTAVVALLVGVMGLRSLSASADASQRIYQHNLQAVDAAAHMDVAIYGMRQKARDALIAVSRTDAQTALDGVQSGRAEFDEAAQRYRAGGLDEKRQQLFDELTTALDQPHEKQKTVRAPLALASADPGGLKANTGVMKPLTTAMTDSITSLNELEASDAKAAAAS